MTEQYKDILSCHQAVAGHTYPLWTADTELWIANDTATCFHH